MAKAKEVAVGKRAKISEAQQYMLFAVIGASLFLGAGIALTKHFVSEIAFNADVIAEEEASMAKYSDAIKNIGICAKPKGTIYSDDELRRCNPNETDTSEVPNTLRSNILENLAANKALNSVPKESSTGCINPSTNKNYTYDEINKIYSESKNVEERAAATKLIKVCSALRVIPDALPAYKNEEALLSSLNKIFIESGWTPESLSPSGESDVAIFGQGLNGINVNFSANTNMANAMTIIYNIERSIRDFNIKQATIEWVSGDSVNLSAQAEAFYMQKSILSEQNVVKKEGQ